MTDLYLSVIPLKYHHTSNIPVRLAEASAIGADGDPHQIFFSLPSHLPKLALSRTCLD